MKKKTFQVYFVHIFLIHRHSSNIRCNILYYSTYYFSKSCTGNKKACDVVYKFYII